LPAMECSKMSTINGGHYQTNSIAVRAGTPDGYFLRGVFKEFKQGFGRDLVNIGLRAVW
jgi:hypothetical protein